jgi:hypothetical protein
MLFAIAIASGCSDSHNTMPIPQMQAKLGATFSGDTPEVVVVGGRAERHGDHTYHVAELVLVNHLAVPISYHGYRMDSWQTRPPAGKINPLYSREIKTTDDSGWHAEITGWCGTGADTMIVPPKHAGRFDARIEMPALSAKVGFVCSWHDANGKQHEEKVWSEDFIGTTPHPQKAEQSHALEPAAEPVSNGELSSPAQ